MAVRAQKVPGAKAFEDQVIAYKNLSLGPTVNLLKHGESRLRVLAFRSRFAFTLGYFIDGPQRGGIIGPAPTVHHDGNSAFSFNRDILIHWWWLYRMSELLLTASGGEEALDDAGWCAGLRPACLRLGRRCRRIVPPP
jgi:hypothetical protein